MNEMQRAAAVRGLALFSALSALMSLGIALLYGSSVAKLDDFAILPDRHIRILARPVRIAVGDRIRRADVDAHLRSVGYFEIGKPEPGGYQIHDDSLTVWARYAELSSMTIRWSDAQIATIVDSTGIELSEAFLEPTTLLTLDATSNPPAGLAISNPVPFAVLADSPLLDAVVASEDGSFFENHGVDFPRLALAPILGGGASTITAQVARIGVLQDRSRTLTRKFRELGLAMALARKYSKEAIVTSYANSVDLGASRGRHIHGFAAAAQELFAVADIRTLTLLQAATLVAALNRPSVYLAATRRGDDRLLRAQRNRVLRLMARRFGEKYPEAIVEPLKSQPVVFADPPPSSVLIPAHSRYFLDAAMARLPSITHGRVYLTLDTRLQTIAANIVTRGITNIERGLLSGTPSQVQAALIAIDPRTGDVLAIVGGRSYDDSMFNRAIAAKRQVGSVIKPFDYLAALERAVDEGWESFTGSTIVIDTPTVFRFGGRPWAPSNYGQEYDGPVTWRRALARSRNIPAIKVAAIAGFDRVARLWGLATGQEPPSAYPSIALGAVEATPADVARAYSAFVNGGVTKELRTIASVIDRNQLRESQPLATRRIARPDTTFVVTDMLRAVLDEGTARAARAAGFSLDAAGKTGTTDDLRDAWFVGFTPELLAVVWVGRDDNRPVGLTGAQAALPLWTEFMISALREHADVRFERPASTR